MIMFNFVSLPIVMVVTEGRGTRGSAVGWRLRVRFSIVSLEFFTHIILPFTLWSWGRHGL